MHVQINIYIHFKKKDGEDIIRNVCLLWKTKKILHENQCSYKIYQNMLERRTNTTFCESQLSTEEWNTKFKRKTEKLVMVTQLQNKHMETKKTKKKLWSI